MLLQLASSRFRRQVMRFGGADGYLLTTAYVRLVEMVDV
jgi:hypothetical protein